MNASDKQHGGTHYRDMGISPWDVIDTWPLEQRIGFYRGSLLKYNMRLDAKDSRSDNAGKAAHLAQKLHQVLSEATPDICPITSQACHDTPCPTAIDCSDRVPVDRRACPVTGLQCDRKPTCEDDWCTRPGGGER